MMVKRLFCVLTCCALLTSGCAGGKGELSSGGAPRAAEQAKVPATIEAFYKEVEKGQLEAVRAGLDAHPEWLSSTDHPWEVTPLNIAAFAGKNDVVALLLARGADVNAHSKKWGWRPIHEAAGEGHKEIVKLLIEHGADIDVETKEGVTPLFVAAGNGHKEVVLLLLARGARADARNKEGSTLLHTAAGGADAELATTLLACGAAVDAKDNSGRTPLHWAATAQTARLLIEKGADVNATDVVGRSPLHLAAFFGFTDVAEALLDKGARIDAPDAAGLTALDLAADEAQEKCAALLVGKGANVNAPDADGRTPLDHAARLGGEGVSRLLAAAGARPTAVKAVKTFAGTQTRVGPKGQFYVNGKPLVPFGVWQQPDYLVEYYRNLGLSCLVWPPSGGSTGEGSTPAYVGKAEACGLGAIVHFKMELAGMKGIWGWIGGGWPLEQARRSYEMVRRSDGRHIIQCNFGGHDLIKGEDTEFYVQAFRYVDCVVPHAWPEMFENEPRNLRNVALMVDNIRKLCRDRAGGEVSIWPDINPHRWFIQKSKGGRDHPAPTPEEFKFQIWLALIHGADGICIFPISFDPFVYSQIPAQIEERLPQMVGEVQKFSEVLTAEESPLKVAVRGNLKGGIVDSTTRRWGGTDYVFLVNGAAAPQAVRLEVDGLGKSLELRDAMKDAPLAAKDGSYEGNLKGLELRIWQIIPTSPLAGKNGVE